MISDSDSHNLLNSSPPPTWAEAWHLWTVLIPRRSITGRLVFGKVWRRHDGRHLIYKRFIESWVLKRGEVMKQKACAGLPLIRQDVVDGRIERRHN